MFNIMLPMSFLLPVCQCKAKGDHFCINIHRGQGGGRVQLDACILSWASRDKDAEWRGGLEQAWWGGLRGPRGGGLLLSSEASPREGLALFCLSSRAEIDLGADICHENQN